MRLRARENRGVHVPESSFDTGHIPEASSWPQSGTAAYRPYEPATRLSLRYVPGSRKLQVPGKRSIQSVSLTSGGCWRSKARMSVENPEGRSDGRETDASND